MSWSRWPRWRLNSVACTSRHVRNEGTHLLEAIDELLTIARHSGAPAEIWHLKAAGPANWHKLERRSSALRLLAPKTSHHRDMYTYSASASGLDATMPGCPGRRPPRLVTRMQDPSIRARLRHELARAGADQQNEFLGATRSC